MVGNEIKFYLIAQGNAFINRFYNKKQVSFVYSLAVLGNHPGDPVMLILRVKQLTVVTLETVSYTHLTLPTKRIV